MPLPVREGSRMFCGGILLFCYCMYISDYSPPFRALGACDAFLRSVGAQALRGGLAKNGSGKSPTY